MRAVKDVIVSHLHLVLLGLASLSIESLPPLVEVEMLESQHALIEQKFRIRQEITIEKG